MRKFVFLIGIIIFPLNVRAEEFYTNYYLKEKEVENFYEESDLLKREEKYLYNNYYEKRVNEGYYELDKNPQDAPLIDKNDSIYEYKGYFENSEDDNEPLYGLGRINTLLNIKCLKIYNVSENAKIKNIRIYNKGVLTNYTMTGYDFNKVSDYTNPTIKIVLNEQVHIEDLTVEFELLNSTTEDLKFSLWISRDGFAFNVLHLNKNFNIPYKKGKQIFIFNILSFSKYNDEIKTINWIENKNVPVFYYYKRKYIFYKYYNISKIKINKYTSKALDGYLLDLDDKRIVYNYFARDKIEIKDIWNENEPLENMIVRTSIIDKSNIKLTLYKNDDEENILIIKYKDDTFYKKIKIIKNDNKNLPLQEPKKEEDTTIEEISKADNERENNQKEITDDEVCSKDNELFLEKINKYPSLNKIDENVKKENKKINVNNNSEQAIKQSEEIRMNGLVGIFILMLFMFILRFIYKCIHENKE